jgi:hypothetical protein
MFRRFAGQIPDGALRLFACHPLELETLLELAWQRRALSPSRQPGHPAHRSDLNSLPDPVLEGLRSLSKFSPPTGEGTSPAGTLADAFESLPNVPGAKRVVLWDHLIYAYMIENTRVYEIFRRVLSDFLHGERLGVARAEAQAWLRNTEELFYRDPPSFSISAISSYIRPDMGATRRNAYQRMFGMDLNHGTDDGQPYAYVRAEAANAEFASTFEEFLREIWVGITHARNTSGSDPTDDSKIADLAEKLHDMLTSRRVNGNLSREEFVAVSTMSWFHLALDFNSPIVESLNAEAASPEQRLFKIAQRVGLPAHGLSKNYFDIADAISQVLTLLETGQHNTPEAVRAFYTDGSLRSAVNTIITHWSAITGRDAKAGKVSST